ncbi:MAG: hypothetical protein ACTSQ8_21040 [Candidatus Helarchaeota archaeon]
MTVFFTIISGVVVFVLGQIALKLFVEPWQRQRDCVAQIAHVLMYYANVYSNPGLGTEERNSEASVETRRVASELIASCYRIPFYRIVSRSPLFPSMDEVNDARKHLIGLSNSTHDGEPLKNGARVNKIRQMLKIPDDE